MIKDEYYYEYYIWLTGYYCPMMCLLNPSLKNEIDLLDLGIRVLPNLNRIPQIT